MSLIRKHRAVLQAWACLALVIFAAWSYCRQQVFTTDGCIKLQNTFTG